ncbi:unnamed protein product, partial [Lepidochelys olivacea]
HGLNRKNDLEGLLKGMTELKVEESNVPSHLLIHGSLAFPVGLDDSHQSFLAAAHYGRGRAVVASHEKQLYAPAMKTFILNAIHWLEAEKGGKVGLGNNMQNLCPLLSQEKILCELADLEDNLCVYCCTANSDRGAEKMQEFVAEGGRLLIRGQAWSWATGNTGHHAIAEYPSNQILNKFGIAILEKILAVLKYLAVCFEDVSSHYHFRWKLGEDSTAFIKIPAQDSPPLFSIQKEPAELVLAGGVPHVSAENPIKGKFEEAVLIHLAAELYNIFPEFQK